MTAQACDHAFDLDENGEYERLSDIAKHPKIKAYLIKWGGGARFKFCPECGAKIEISGHLK